jgi:hypothetical protein
MMSASGVEVVAAPDGAPARGWRSAVEWSATSAPVALLLITGIALGPQGINLLSTSVLPLLDPVVPVALAALGVLVGLGSSGRRPGNRRVVGAATLGASVTLLIVGLGVEAVAATDIAASVPLFWALAALSAISAATSLTLPSGDPLEPVSSVARVREAGVLLPIVAGGLLIVLLRADSATATLTLLGQATAITLALAAAGWLLLTRTSSVTEERVFAISALLLVGGAADALSQSALLVGLIAGVFWRHVGGGPRDTLRRDVLFVQHPLLVLVLLVAGARAELSPVAMTLGLIYAILRVAGTLIAGQLAAHVGKPHVSGDLGRQLLRPGVFGVAFALNAATIAGGDASILLATVVAGTIASEAAALLLPPRGGSE